MFYEKELNSFPRLMQELQALDIDGGIRTFGRYSAKKCIVFLTKSAKGYATAIYTLRREGKLVAPDKCLLIQEFEGESELKAFLEKVLIKPVKAYSY